MKNKLTLSVFRCVTKCINSQVAFTMSAQDAAQQLGALGELMDVMDAFDDEDRQNRAKKKRAMRTKPWLLLRDNPRYIMIKML